MSGIRIDVEARANDAKRELRRLNESLSDLFRNANFSSKALHGVFKAKGSNKLNTDVNATTRSFKKMGREGQQSIAKVNREGMQTQKIFNSIQRTVVGIGAGIAAWYGVGALNRASDELAGYSNKLQLVHNSTLAVLKVQNRLYNLSKDTRSVLEDNVKLYVDLAKASERSNRSQDESIAALDTLQRMAAISGSPVESLRAAFVQLGQGLSAGALRGEELNSVMEQMKPLSHALQKELNLSAGALREFAATGGITDAVIFRTLRNSAEETKEVFERTVIRIDQASAQMSTAATVLKGTFAEMTGYTQVISQFFLKARDAFEKVSHQLVFGFAALQLEYHNTLIDMKRDPELKRLLDEYGEIGVKIAFLGKQFGLTNEMVKSVPGLESLLKVISKLFSALTSVNLKEVFAGTGSVILKIVDTAGVALSKLSGYLGNVSTTLTSFVKSFGVELIKGASFLNAGVTSEFFRMADALGRVNDAINPFATAKNVERAFVDIFRSNSFYEFLERWSLFNDEMTEGRNWAISRRLTTFGKSLDSLLNPLRNVLVGLDLMDNRLVFFRQTRLDSLIRDFNLLRGAISRTFDAIIVPALFKYVWPAVYRLGLIAVTIADAIGDTFMALDGEAAARALLSVIEGFVDILASGLQSVGRTLDFVSLIPDSSILAAAFIDMFARVFIGLSTFILDFFNTFGRGVGAHLLAGLSLGMNFAAEKIGIAGAKLKKVTGQFLVELVAALNGLGTGIFESLSEGFEDFSETLGNFFKSGISKLRAIANAVEDFSKETAAAFSNTVSNSSWLLFVTSIIDSAKTLYYDALAWIRQFVTAVEGQLRDIGFNASNFENLSKIIDIIAASILLMTAAMSDSVLSTFSESLSRVSDNLSAVVAKLRSLAGGLASPSELVESFLELFQRLSNALYASAKEGFSKALRMVASFGQTVKEIFWDMYIAVVGNSYWPDLIDGVIGETDRLSEAAEKVRGFAADVSSQFRRLTYNYGEIEFSPDLKLGDVLVAVAGVDWANVARVVMANLFAAISATMGVFAKSALVKLGSVGFFIGLFGDAFKVSAEVMVGTLGEGLGRVVSAFLTQLLDGMVTVLNTFVATVPEIMRGMSKALFSGLGDTLSNALAGTIELIFSNAVINGLVAGVVGYGLIAGKGLKPLADLFLGKVAGPGQGRSGGLFQTLFPNFSGLLGGVSRHFNKLGVVALGAFAAPFLFDAVGIFEGLAVAIPLALASMLGAQGSQRLISDIFVFLIQTARKAFGFLASLGAAVFPGLAASIAGLFSGGSASAAAFGAAVRRVGNAIGFMYSNILAYGAAYGAGQISFFQMLFGNNLGAAGVINAFANLGIAIQDLMTALVSAIGGIFRKITGKLMVVIRAIGQVGLFIFQFLSAVFTALRRAVVRAVVDMTTGLVQLILKYKIAFGIMTILAASFFSGYTQASAFGTAVSDTSSEIGKLVGLVAGVLGFVLAFQKVKDAVMATKAAMALGGISGTKAVVSTFLSALFTLPAELVGFGDRFRTATRGAGTAIWSFASIITTAMTTLVMSVVKGTGLLLLATGQFLAGLTGFALTVSGSGALIARSFATLYASISTIVVGFSTATSMLLGLSMSGLFSAMAAWVMALAGPLQILRRGIKDAFLYLITWIKVTRQLYGAQILALAKRWGMIAVAVGGAGAIGLYLFGPEGTIGQKLEYVIDKVKELFGLQPGGGLARFAKVVKGLKGLGGQEQVLDIRAALSQVDLESTSELEFARLARLMQATADSLVKIEDAIFTQSGEITAAQERELDKLSKTVLRATSKLPQDNLDPFEAAFKQASESIVFSNFAFTRALDRLLSGDSGEDRPTFQDITGQIRESDKRMTEWTNAVMSDAVADLPARLQDSFKRLGAAGLEDVTEEVAQTLFRFDTVIRQLNHRIENAVKDGDFDEATGLSKERTAVQGEAAAFIKALTKAAPKDIIGDWFDSAFSRVKEAGTIDSIVNPFMEQLENPIKALSHFSKKNAISAGMTEDIVTQIEGLIFLTERLNPLVDDLDRNVGGLPEEDLQRLQDPSSKIDWRLDAKIRGKMGDKFADDFAGVYKSWQEQVLGLSELHLTAVKEAAENVNAAAFKKFTDDLNADLGLAGAKLDFEKDLLSPEALDRIRLIGDNIVATNDAFEDAGGKVSALNTFDNALIQAVNQRSVEFEKALSNQNAFFGTKLEGIDDIVGLGKDPLINFTVNSTNTNRAFESMAESAQRAKSAAEDLLLGSASPKEISDAYRDMFDKRMASLRTMSDFSSITLVKAFRKNGDLEELSNTVFANIGDALTEKLGKAARAVNLAAIAYQRELAIGTGLTQRAALKELEAARREAGKVDVGAKLVAFENLRGDMGITNTLALAKESAKIFGEDVPEAISKVPPKLLEWMDLQAKIHALQGVISLPNVTDENSKMLQEWVDKYKQRIEELSRVATLATSLSFLPKDLTEGSFSKLSTKVQDTLIGLSEVIERERKKREEGLVIGSSLARSLRIESEAIADANELLVSTLFDTPRKIQDALDSYDIAPTGKASDLFNLLRMDAAVTQLRTDLDKAFAENDRETALTLLATIAVKESAADAFADKIRKSLEGKLSDLKASFSVEMEMSSFAEMSDTLRAILGDAAAAVKQAFKELAKGTMTPQDAARLENVRRNLSGIVNTLVTAETALQRIARSGTAGLKTLFESVVKGGTSITQELIDFTSKERGTRESMFSERTALKAIEDIALSDNLPAQVAQLINDGIGNTSPEKLLEQISAIPSFDLAAEIGTPLEQNTAAMQTLRKALEDAAIAFKGGEKKEPAEPPKVKSGDILGKTLAAIKIRSESFTAAASVSPFKGQKEQILAISKGLGISISGIEDLSENKLARLYDKLSAIVKLYEGVDLSSEEDIEEFKERLRAGVEGFKDLVDALSEAQKQGKAFSEGLKSDFQSGLTDILSGKNTSFSDFGHMLLDKFTMGVLEAFSAGVVEELFSGVFMDMLSGIGEDTSEAGGGTMGILKSVGKGTVDAGMGLFTSDDDDEAENASAGFFTSLRGSFNELSEDIDGSFFTTIGNGFSSLVSTFMSMLPTGGGGGGGLFGVISGIAGMFTGTGAMGADVGSMVDTSGLFAKGGRISGNGTGVSDSIPIWASNGEFMINAKDTQKNLGLLHAINNGESFSMFAEGGPISSRGMDAVNNLPSERMRGTPSQIINVNITGDISRQTKSEIHRMLPSIAQGVNMHNREKGSRG